MPPYDAIIRRLKDPLIPDGRSLGNATNSSGGTPSDTYSLIQVANVVAGGNGENEVLVQLRNQQSTVIPCKRLSIAASTGTGFGIDSNIALPEKTEVLVLIDPSARNRGYIISAITPESFNVLHAQDKIDPDTGVIGAKETALFTERMAPSGVKSIGYSRAAEDLFTGEMSLHNEYGIGYDILRHILQLMGSEKAKIELSNIDDAVKIISGLFKHYSALGTSQIYNDNGCNTLEFLGSPHQCELQGMKSFVSPFKEEDDVYSLKESNQVPYSRLTALFGHLGGIFQFYLSSLDPKSVSPNTSDKNPINPGLFRTALDENGRLLVQSASDIILQRTDRIVVPVKKKEPWEPGNSNEPKYTPKTPFIWFDESFDETTDLTGIPQEIRSLQLRDYIGWAVGQSYLRLKDSSQLTDPVKESWYLPDLTEAVIPEDEYDNVDSTNTENYNNNADKMATIMLGQDGSITLRNSEGAEISLIGKNINITCPGEISLTSGGNTVVMAKNSLIAKAKNNVELVASQGDMRLKSENNMQAVSGQGVLIESLSTDESIDFSKPGTEAVSKGVVIKASGSRALVSAKNTHLNGTRTVNIEALDGDCNIGARRVRSAFKILSLASDGGDGLIVTNGSSKLIGASVGLEGSSSVYLSKGHELGGVIWSGGPDLFSASNKTLKGAFNRLFEDTEWISPYTKAELDKDKIGFTYCTSEQYDTQDRLFVEPFWQLFNNIPFTEWKDTEIRGTKAYPGKETAEGRTLYKLNAEVNISDLTYKKFKELKDQTPVDSFELVKFEDNAG